MSHANTNIWSFDLSSFMILLGEGEEFNYRLIRRSFCECLCAAPVAGFQSYSKPYNSLVDNFGPTYISPLGGKSAPLRNLRSAHTITSMEVLRDFRFTLYQIPDTQSNTQDPFDIRLLLWTATTWACFSGIIIALALYHDTTWIGPTNCALLSGWSIILRLAERRCTETATNNPTRPHDRDVVIFLGRRNSCFVLEGSRKDICTWTGLGIQIKDDTVSSILQAFTRITSLLVMIFVFATIPNGTLPDQISFIAINIVAQINVKMGQHLNARRYLSSLTKITEAKVETRTHVYGLLIRRFGAGKWVDQVDLIPRTSVWEKWRRLVVESPEDPKDLYEQCLVAELEKEDRSGSQSSRDTQGSTLSEAGCSNLSDEKATELNSIEPGCHEVKGSEVGVKML